MVDLDPIYRKIHRESRGVVVVIVVVVGIGSIVIVAVIIIVTVVVIVVYAFPILLPSELRFDGYRKRT